MYKICISKTLCGLLFLLLCFRSYSQQILYKHPSILGIHFTLQDVEKSRWSNEKTSPDAGFQLSYLKGLNRRFDWQVGISGSFPDSLKTYSNAKGSKAVFLQTDIALRLKLFDSDRIIQPYVLAGTGLAQHHGNTGGYFLIGPGMEWHIRDVFLLAGAQYRFSVTRRFNNHYQISLGIAGLLGKPKPQKVFSTRPSDAKTIIKDRDGDGIADSLDLCPDQAGVPRLEGCPDEDGDGIRDAEDDCPGTPGLAALRGCPFLDGDDDGIADKEDQCVNEPGPKENGGCPVIANQVQQQLALAAKSIFFKSGSHELLPISFAALDAVSTVLKKNGGLTLTIEGHTDNIGSAKANQALSEDRARAVATYLTGKGIDRSRLQAIGYGMEKPIAENNTPEGKAKNRRVEIHAN